MEVNLARFRSLSAVYVDATAVGRIPAGRTIADSQANAVAGDVIWNGLVAANLPAGFVPLDAGGTTMRSASPWATTPFPATITGTDSIG
jgi:hypothetical protein